MKQVPKKCPTCTFTIGHADDCEYQSRKTLSDTEDKYWRGGFVQGDGDPAAGDRMLRKYWAHLDSDVPSLLKDPSLHDPNWVNVGGGQSIGFDGEGIDADGQDVDVWVSGHRVTVHLRSYDSAEGVLDAINAELGKRELQKIMEPG